MRKYLIGFLFNLLNKRISIFALIDNKSKVSPKAKVYYGAKVFDTKISAYSYVGPRSILVHTDIGKFCSIANDCSIGLAVHSLTNISTSPIFTSKKNGTGSTWTNLNLIDEYRRTILGNDVWIGTKVIIMGGVKIGNGVIIGAGSIVTKDIPDYAIAVGIPAKVIKCRFENTTIEKLSEIKWWNWKDEKLKENIKIFQKRNFNLLDLNSIDYHE